MQRGTATIKQIVHAQYIIIHRTHTFSALIWAYVRFCVCNGATPPAKNILSQFDWLNRSYQHQLTCTVHLLYTVLIMAAILIILHPLYISTTKNYNSGFFDSIKSTY